MVLGEAVIVAGIGCRKGVSATDVLAAIRAALDAHGLAIADLSAVATTAFKKDEAAIFAAAAEIGVEVIVVGEGTEREDTAIVETLTHSALSQATAGTPSVSEFAALAAAGRGARLLGPRIAVARVTCALATNEAAP